MRIMVIVAGVVVCGLASPAFATMASFHSGAPSEEVSSIPAGSQVSFFQGVLHDIVVAQNGPTLPPGNSGSNGNNNGNMGKSGKPACNTVSPSHPCMGNNGFGNGGSDGSPNGFPDVYR